jgi:H+/Cl- antiporter ClcA
MIIGCGIGFLYQQLHILIFPSKENSMDVETMTILGATAVLSGATRMTYSLAVIMMETTQNVSLFLPIIFTLFSSYGAASILISKSIYAGALRSKNIPVLGKSIPKVNRNLNAA